MLKDYFAYYKEEWHKDPSPSALNRKLPREAFRELLDAIGCTLRSKADELANQPGTIRQFLDDNPLPERLSTHLPVEFRVFCLALNALKVWVSAEQAATDRYLLGGRARQECREAADRCIVTGEPLMSKDDVELHHPVRDGRPPIPLSQKGHDLVEKQAAVERDDSILSKLFTLRKKGNHSWAQLRRGCLEHLGKNTAHETQKVDARSMSFAHEASRITGKNYEELLQWLDENGK